MKRKILLILYCLFLIGITGCCRQLYYYEGPHRGKAIDYGTKEPIEGVVVLGEWSTTICTVAGAVSNFYDLREAVSDEKGEFIIPRMGPRIMSSLLPMDTMIFKAGYGYTGGWWHNYQKKDNKGRTIIRLEKLTLEQRKRGMGEPQYPPSQAPLNKYKRYMEEFNKDRIERGFKPH